MPPACRDDTPKTDTSCRADFQFVFGVSLSDLLGRAGINDLVAHTDDPDTSVLGCLHRADTLAHH